MTNQQKLQTLRNLTGPSLYSVIIKELGPGTIHIPLDDGIPESRNLKIRAEFNSPEFEDFGGAAQPIHPANQANIE